MAKAMATARAAVIGLLVVAATTCSDDEGVAPTSTTTTSTTAPAPQGSAGCGGTRPNVARDGLLHRTVTSGGEERGYLVYVPARYEADVPAPVVYDFHGALSYKEQQLVYGDFRPESEQDGALLVLPDAIGPRRRWSPLGAAFEGDEEVDDLAFFDDLAAAVEAELCVDPDRVLVTGMSSGGFMAAAVACTRSSKVSAVGPVTATVSARPLCAEAEPVPYSYFHGTDDAVVPFEGGGRSPGPVEETSQAWAEHNGCAPEPADERIGTDVVHRSWSGCDAPTDLYIVEGGGHTWPGAMKIGSLGHTTDDIDASEIIWEMFRATWSAT